MGDKIGTQSCPILSRLRNIYFTFQNSFVLLHVHINVCCLEKLSACLLYIFTCAHLCMTLVIVFVYTVVVMMQAPQWLCYFVLSGSESCQMLQLIR